jgi:hypothetical protein
MQVARMSEAFERLGPSFSFKPFSSILQPLIEEALAERGKDKFRRGTILIPQLLVWLVLGLTVRRDLNCQKVLNWLVSGLRWMQLLLPAKGTIVQDGAISHARVKMGVEVFRALFVKLTGTCQELKADFHGLVTVIFDGTTGTMPDTESNENEFKRPKSGRGKAAFPPMRIMALMAWSARVILDIAYAACCGKGTGERTLVMQILDRTSLKNLLFLLDAGLYSFELLWKTSGNEHKFIVKAPKTVKLKPNHILSDGSYLARLKGKVLDPDAPPTKSGRRRWKKVSLLVRVIRLEIPGYRLVTLVTNLLDPEITAREIALHYHQRWDIEIAYDEIKTHQCVTLRGQSPTTFRSKRADLVQQELYALVIMYNLVRLLIAQAATKHDKDPRFISFLDALQHIIDAAPIMTADPTGQDAEKLDHLLDLIADCDIDRPRRQRINPRVVKVKMSNFRKKNDSHKSEYRNIEKELRIIWEYQPAPQNPPAESRVQTREIPRWDPVKQLWIWDIWTLFPPLFGETSPECPDIALTFPHLSKASAN